MNIERLTIALHVLRWHVPHVVGGIDFPHSPLPIDNQYPFFLAVHDLASGNVILALTTPTKELQHVNDALATLIRQHGAPLVIKAKKRLQYRLCPKVR